MAVLQDRKKCGGHFSLLLDDHPVLHQQATLAARGQVVVTLDADLAHYKPIVDDLIQAIEEEQHRPFPYHASPSGNTFSFSRGREKEANRAFSR